MDRAHSFIGSLMDSMNVSWAKSSIAKKAHPIRFHKSATAAITQYQRGTADFACCFIFSSFCDLGLRGASNFKLLESGLAQIAAAFMPKVTSVATLTQSSLRVSAIGSTL